MISLGLQDKLQNFLTKKSRQAGPRQPPSVGAAAPWFWASIAVTEWGHEYSSWYGQWRRAWALSHRVCRPEPAAQSNSHPTLAGLSRKSLSTPKQAAQLSDTEPAMPRPYNKQVAELTFFPVFIEKMAQTLQWNALLYSMSIGQDSFKTCLSEEASINVQINPYISITLSKPLQS